MTDETSSGGFADDHPLHDGRRRIAGRHVNDGLRASSKAVTGRCGAAGRGHAAGRGRRDRCSQAGRGILVDDAAREQPAIVAAALRMFAALQPAAERQSALADFVVVQTLGG